MKRFSDWLASPNKEVDIFIDAGMQEDDKLWLEEYKKLEAERARLMEVGNEIEKDTELVNEEGTKIQKWVDELTSSQNYFEEQANKVTALKEELGTIVSD